MAPTALPKQQWPSTNGFAAKNLLNGRLVLPVTTQNAATEPPAGDTMMSSNSMKQIFLAGHQELVNLREGAAGVILDGSQLTLAGVVAASRYGCRIELTQRVDIRDKVARSHDNVVSKLEAGKSIYGVSTGFGGSADTRTSDHSSLGKALLQHLHIGILPSTATTAGKIFPLSLSDEISATSMPESWVRAAIVVRMNSLVRGHSGVRWELVESMADLLAANITPLVPLRGSISASGDLSPLSYVAGTLIGNQYIRVWDGPENGPRRIVPCTEAFRLHGLKHLTFSPKEHLGILNGTSFSAAVASLALHDAVQLTMLAQILTAMGTEATIGAQGSYDAFIHRVARPHPGQVEAADTIRLLLSGSKLAVLGHPKEVTIDQDAGTLRQDRYPFRTAPQFLGPQLEDLTSAYHSVTLECNSTTDNPLSDGETGEIHHGGNFQAMHVTNAMEKTRLALHHVGKLLFAQSTEILNPSMNRGLAPSLASTDPSVNYHCKGLDTATASYVSELGFLANPVSTHIQSAEMHNQSVNSLALISARATVTALDVLSMLTASYLYILCQALDLRAMNAAFDEQLKVIVKASFQQNLTEPLGVNAQDASRTELLVLDVIRSALCRHEILDMDAADQMQAAVESSTSRLMQSLAPTHPNLSITYILSFQTTVALGAAEALQTLRSQFIGESGGCALPASPLLAQGTRPVYEFVRKTLGVPMHGIDNLKLFEDGFTEFTIGHHVSTIYESIKNGQMQDVMAGVFNSLEDPL